MHTKHGSYSTSESAAGMATAAPTAVDEGNSVHGTILKLLLWRQADQDQSDEDTIANQGGILAIPQLGQLPPAGV